MVGTVLMGTFPTTTPAAATAPAESSDTTVEPPLLAASESVSSRLAVPIADTTRADAASAQATSLDATTVDLLLAVTDHDEQDEPESTEFVGESDQRDAAPEAVDLVFETTKEDSKSPTPARNRS